MVFNEDICDNVIKIKYQICVLNLYAQIIKSNPIQSNPDSVMEMLTKYVINWCL